MGNLYRPSNGTEGEYFKAKFCDRCEHDDPHNFREQGEKLCGIHTRALIHDTAEPEYPIEWVYQDERPTCTVFIEHVPSELEMGKIKSIRRAYLIRRLKRLPYRIVHYRPDWWAHRKLSVAALIHKHKPETCWADWVSWSFGHKPISEVLDSGGGCREDAERSGACYCGQFQKGQTK